LFLWTFARHWRPSGTKAPSVIVGSECRIYRSYCGLASSNVSGLKTSEAEIAVGKRVAFVRVKDQGGRRDKATNVVIMLPVP
jgi:hypothetical protein